jgi:hypothetical protein
MTQADLCFDAPVKLPPHGTQNYRLLMAMQCGARLTVAKALNEYGVFALSQRCTELRKMGWPIKSNMVKLPSGARVAEYWMAEPPPPPPPPGPRIVREGRVPK